MRNVFWLAGLFGAALLCHSCAGQRPEPVEVADAGAGRRVLIATGQSDFKNALTARLVEGLKERRCGLRVIPVDGLTAEAAAGFDAFVIIDSCRAGSLSGPARRHLAAPGAAERTVLVPTSGNGRWKPAGRADAVSCASKPAESGKAAAEILAQLDRLLVGAKSAPARDAYSGATPPRGNRP
ncbi:MAG TPA: hypothetical protein PK280_01470 [Planctomycetota bacterium]|nr:hypothetical protein [Planctomycetota bacterium]